MLLWCHQWWFLDLDLQQIHGSDLERSHTENNTVAMTDQNDVKQLLLSWIITSSVTGESSSPTTHCLCLSSGLLVSWPSSPWPPVTKEDSRRKQTQTKRVRPMPHSQNTGSFFSFWLDVFHSHHFYFCDRELQLIRFVSVGHHYTCTNIAIFLFFLIYLCIK